MQDLPELHTPVSRGYSTRQSDTDNGIVLSNLRFKEEEVQVDYLEVGLTLVFASRDF